MAVSELEETIPDLVGCHLVPVLLDLIRTDAEEVSVLRLFVVWL